MIKESKNVDFLTTVRQPSKEEFARISEWIKRKISKSRQIVRKENVLPEESAGV